MAFIKHTYEPIKITYINSKQREVIAYGVFSWPTIRIGSRCYFRAIDDENKLIKSNDKTGRQVGTIIDFEYLDTK